MNIRKIKQSGYATVTLMVFVVICLTVTAAATTITLINSLGASKMQQGTVALDVAESGLENGILRFLRDPNYTGEILIIGSDTAEISVATLSPGKYSITSEGKSGNFQRKIEAQVDYTNNLNITSWREIY